jgi:hypothetical protein
MDDCPYGGRMSCQHESARPPDIPEGRLVTTPGVTKSKATGTKSKSTGKMTRRGRLKITAASAALPLVRSRSGRAAGKASIAFCDHWVPSGNAVMQKQVDARAAKNQMEVQADFITAVGQENILTIAAEAQAKTGFDVQAFLTREVRNNAELLEPIDDVMKRLTDKYGQVNEVCNYLAKVKLHWLAVPAPPELAVQIYHRGTMPTMLAKLKSGDQIDKGHCLGK